MVLPVRPYPGEQEREPPPVEELPGLAASLVPVVLPLAMISADTILRAFVQPTGGGSAPSGWIAALASALAMLGNPNLALLISAGIALRLVARTRRLSLAQLARVAEEGLTNCGVMILLVCAGAAFGSMLGEARVGQLIEQVFPRGGASSAVATLWIAFAATVGLKIVVGSSTVAIATSSGMLAALDTSAAVLGCHPVYLAMAVSVGSLVFSWMNDPGFWLITRMSGMTETEALKSWTPWSACLGLSGMLLITLAAWFVPLA
jgi:GntP family gluconate:H+ symporter